MKFLILPLLLLSSTAFAAEPLTKVEKGEVELLLAEAASKLLYLERDCGKPMDVEKFKELAKIKAFSEGYMTIEGISWERVKKKAHQGYGMLKIEAPLGELCDDYRAQIKGNYRFLKEI
ncbi:hypothetical protein CMT41_10350 [Colwellia sp. MT41]|uniref:Uncharacterized protein n=1 Tax=Colwellia marinimaniae TaxID=1513592 RepID=A0ABQ0MS20_9GAMM|nr:MULTISPECIES: hypothetical protein [Colwellia]ALO35073.1 hypothetical protein CMT41_10350 [Colwellia sp. MT41]GAW95157.1 hypothetical protein MTCD1_00756 [Colwellia marinimaniae]